MRLKRETGRRGRAALRRARLAATERTADVQEAAELIQLFARLLVDPLARREPIKTWITRTAEQLNFERARAEDIWWKQARRIDAWEMEALRAAVRAHVRRAAR